MSNISLGSTALFQSALNRQRKDKFIMVFNLPDALLGKNSKFTRNSNRIISDSVQFSIYGLVVPQVSIPDIKAPYAGQTVKVTSYVRPPYEPLEVDFMVDNMFNNYWAIYQWLNLFNDDRTGIYNSPLPRDTGSLEKYKTTISVYGLDEFDKKVIKFDFHSAFPISLGGIKYSDRDPGEMQSSFKYAFHQFEPILL